MAESQGVKVPAPPSSDSPWTNPDPNLVRVQTILFSSLAVSLLAAFVAMLGKQWLNRYSQADMHGSLIQRSRDRQRKINGMTRWHFNLVMEFLPLMLQFALLLLGYALSDYLLTIDNLIAWVVAGFTASGVFFYTFIVIAAILSYDCPFQTPFSLLVHFIIRFDNKHKKYLENSRRWFRRTFKKRRRSKSGEPKPPDGSDTPDADNPRDHIELTMVGSPNDSPASFKKETDWDGFVLDANCIAWMFKMSMDEDVILHIMKFIPEIIWHNGVQTVPLEKLYDTVLECFDNSSGSPVVISKFKDKAYSSAKALVHLAIQRQCIGNESDTAAFASISSRHTILGSRHYDGDSDLEYTLGMIDRVFGTGNPTPMRWDKFSFSNSHHAWMAHILLYRAWYALKLKDGPLPDDISQFLRHSLRRDPLPPPPIISDCLLIIGQVLGIELDINDQHGIDKRSVDFAGDFFFCEAQFPCPSQKIQSQIRKIYAKLMDTFKDPASTASKIDRALEAMRLITPLPESGIAVESYRLFHVIMQAPVSSAYSDEKEWVEKKWEASRLALHGAYKWDKVLPWVEDPRNILAFLSHHFELADANDNHDEPIQNALRALAYASTPKTIEALKNLDPTQSPFARGVCFALQDARPLKLRKATLFFLALIADKWFNTSDPIMTPDEMKILCADWASAVDEVGHSAPAVQKAALAVLLEMMNSPHWRPHIVPEKWRLLEYFTSVVPDDSQALKRCLDNAELVQDISNMGNQDAMSLWSAILWLKYSELKPEVQRQLEGVTKGAQRWDFERYLSVIEAEANKAEDELTEFNTWAISPEAAVLRTKIDNLKLAKDSLMALRRGWR